MENETNPPARRASWNEAVTLLIVVILVLIAFNIYDIRQDKSGNTTSLYMGDLYAKYALSANKLNQDPIKYASQAIDQYTDALPMPAAYRRIGITQQAVMGKYGLDNLSKIDSHKAVKGLSKAQIKKLHSEARMWREIYGPEKINNMQADKFAARIKKLNLGPLKDAAVAEVYARAGDAKRANQFLQEAKTQAFQSLIQVAIIMAVFFGAGLLGLALIILFLATNSRTIEEERFLSVPPAVLIYTFLAYLVSYIIYGALFGIVSIGSKGGAVELIFQSVAIIAALITGLTAFNRLAPDVSLASIGMRKIAAGKVLKWGIGGYCAAIPLVVIATYLNLWIAKILFKGFEAPEHPIIPFVTEGGAPLVVAFIIAVVLAPIVEETFFRGMLYTGFRNKLGVWPAVFISAAIFASIHPTAIGQFLPLMMLGVVLALVREKTNSLIPSMLCHATNNLITLLLSRLLF